MKNNSDNQEELQLVLDSIVQTLSEIKEELIISKNSNTVSSESALNVDLLNKISDTIDNAKKAIDEDDLKNFINIIISVTTQLQERANKASAEFLNQKVEELREIAKEPNVIINKYSIDFKSSKMFIVLVFLGVCIGVSLYFNYNQSQENNRLKHNDIKYRYVQMKGGVSYDDIVSLNKFYTERPQYRDSIKSNVIEFEKLVKQKIYNESVNNHNEKENKQIDKKLKELTK